MGDSAHRSQERVVCIPTLNAGKQAKELAEKLAAQSLLLRVLIIDSSSVDGSIKYFSDKGAEIKKIQRSEFDHGGTRNLVFEMVDADIYVFLTQDAIPVDSFAIGELLKAFEDEKVGVAYGRQLAASDATSTAAHARLYNYPDSSRTVAREDIPALGIKAAFCSNSFAAYRRSAIEEVGFFPSKLIFGEDTYAAAKMLLAGWKVSYVAEAQVTHSHNYSLKQEASRYFDLGVSHAEESWLIQQFGRAEGEGVRFVRSELSFLKRANEQYAGLKILVRNGCKYLGYALGKRHAILPRKFKLWLTMNKAYWQ